MLKNICLVPNICYETVLPYVIRNQLVALRQQGQEPQILVNVTNDGWFWGSSELEQHLACGVFRTVECRRADGHRREHGHFGLDRCQRPHPGRTGTAARRRK